MPPTWRFSTRNGQAIDHGLAIHFPAPHSYTGEDVLELQAHGGPVVLQLLLARCLEAGAAIGLRLAEPGEFTERAFLNDKLDLAQAEAVADLIEASTEAAARSAGRSLAGAFSREIDALRERLIELRMLVEATLDFPEEEIDFLEARRRARPARRDLRPSRCACSTRRARARCCAKASRVVLAGQPNVGKSSLLNALAGAELAIVTPIAGTTRDKVSETIQIEGVPVHVIDTAGLRDAADEVERIGVARSWTEIEGADAVVFLHDLTRIGEPGYDAGDARIAERLRAPQRPTRRPASTLPRTPIQTLLRMPLHRGPASTNRLLHVYSKLDLAAAPPAADAPGDLRASPAPASTRCAAGCSSWPAGTPSPRASSSRARATSRRCAAPGEHLARRSSRPQRPTLRSNSSPRNCASRTTRSARSPARSRPTTCSASSSAAFALESRAIAEARPLWRGRVGLHAEVALQQIGLGLELGGRAFMRDVAVVDDVDAACQRQRRGQVLLDQNDRLTGLREIAADAHQILHDHRGESFERFVEQDDLRIAYQRSRDREHLLFAAGEVRAAAGAPLLQPREHRVDAFKRPFVAGSQSGEDDVFLDVEAAKDAAVLVDELHADRGRCCATSARQARHRRA